MPWVCTELLSLSDPASPYSMVTTPGVRCPGIVLLLLCWSENMQAKKKKSHEIIPWSHNNLSSLWSQHYFLQWLSTSYMQNLVGQIFSIIFIEKNQYFPFAKFIAKSDSGVGHIGGIKESLWTYFDRKDSCNYMNMIFSDYKGFCYCLEKVSHYVTKAFLKLTM